MLSFEVFAFCDRFIVITAHVVDSNVAMRVTYGNQIMVLFGELAARDTVIRLDEFLRERGVLQRPEAEITALKLIVLFDANIVLSIACGDKVRIF